MDVTTSANEMDFIYLLEDRLLTKIASYLMRPLTSNTCA